MTTSHKEPATTAFSQQSGLALSYPVRDTDHQSRRPERSPEGPRPLARLPNIPTKPADGRTRLRAFVTGRNTELGRAVIAELLEHGHCVTVFGNGFEHDFKGVVTLVSNLDDCYVMDSVAEQSDAIILCDRPEPGMALPVAIALCRMLVALPPHGRLISAHGAICPDCPDATALDQAILAASNGVPQSVYVLSPALLGRVRTEQLGSTGHPSQGSHAAGQKPVPRSEIMLVEDCARLLVCLAENGAFKGGVVGCATAAASLPADRVHPARLGFGSPLSPGIFGYAALPRPPRTCLRASRGAHGQPQTPAAKERKQSTGNALSSRPIPLGGIQ